MVKCADCGFLATRHVDSRNLVEMEWEYRNTGECPKRRDFSPRYELYEFPFCFKRASDIRIEIKNGKSNNSENIRSVIQKERECESFTKWYQGSTPKEHQEILDRQWMLDFQQKREKEDREWRKQQRDEDLAWRAQQEKKMDVRHRTELWIFGVVVTVALILGSIAAAFIERGGQPTINIITPNPNGVTIEQQP